MKFYCLILLILFFGCVNRDEDMQGNSKKVNKLSKPNFVFIFSDDQTYDAVGSLGERIVETPALDSLVRNGTTFVNAHNMGAWGPAVCVASRRMLNTGKFIKTAYAANIGDNRAKNKIKFWSERLKDAGYKTYFTGKWHVPVKPTEVFDVVGVPRGGMPKQTKARYQRDFDKEDWTPWDKSKGGYWEGGKHWSEIVADDAISFIGDASTAKKPFFMYIAFNAPHDPRQAPKEYIDKYAIEDIKVPSSFLGEYPYRNDIGLKSLRDENLSPYPRTEKIVKINQREYYAIITHMDTQIERILKSLKENNLEENTYVIFTSDHGLAVGQHGFMGKQNLYEHSIKVPFIITGPNIAKNAKNYTDIYLQDIVPTTLDWAKADKSNIDFKSLVPLLSGNTEQHYNYILGYYLNVQRMIKKDGFKLLYYPSVGKYRLYDLEHDPNELNDLIDNNNYRDKIISLKKNLKREDISFPKRKRKKKQKRGKATKFN